MEFEWDEAKRQSNLRKHQFDFYEAVTLFDGPHVITNARTVGAEPRFLATGLLRGGFATIVFTRRGPNIRVISIRSARHVEQRGYQAVHS